MRGRKPIVQCTQGEWRDICDHVRSCCPPPKGYRWRFVWSDSVSKMDRRGDCERLEPKKQDEHGTIVVRVQRGMSLSETIEVLIHEVAHGYDMWTHHAWLGDHSDTFWIWVGRVYRRYWGLETG